MSVKTALILCAGFGKRLEPLTKSIPKPLLKIKDITLLERTLQIIDKLEIKEVKINTFYLEDQIIDFIKAQNGCYFSRITGSGSACIGIFSDMKSTIFAQKLIKLKFPKYWCAISKTM